MLPTLFVFFGFSSFPYSLAFLQTRWCAVRCHPGRDDRYPHATKGELECKRGMLLFAARASRLGTSIFGVFLIFTVHESACLANQLLSAFRTGNGHVGLIDSNMDLAAARLKRAVARFTNKWLFAKTAFDHRGAF